MIVCVVITPKPLCVTALVVISGSSDRRGPTTDADQALRCEEIDLVQQVHWIPAVEEECDRVIKRLRKKVTSHRCLSLWYALMHTPAVNAQQVHRNKATMALC